MLAHAFRDNPLNRAVIGGSAGRRLRSNRWGMRVHLPAVSGVATLRVARCDGRLAGVLVAAPPGHWPLPSPGLRGGLLLMLGQGPRIARRWSHVSGVLERNHPLGPRWYLATLGVDPVQQGRGVGGALLRDWLARVDGDGAPAFLETDHPAVAELYGRMGFETLRQVRILGTPVWLMERPASAG